MNTTNRDSKSFDLKLSGYGFVESLSMDEASPSCVLTAHHGAKESPQQLTIHCQLKQEMARYFDKHREKFIDGSYPIAFTIDDLRLDQPSEPEGGLAHVHGRLSDATPVSIEKFQYKPSDPYLDLHLRGCGYANRIRSVAPKRAKAFWAVTVGALYGPKESIHYTRVDCKVTGSEAKDRIEQLAAIQEASEGAKIFIGFKIGDMYLDTFDGDKGPVTVMKGRLLTIDWARANGQAVFFKPNTQAKSA